MKGRPEWEWNSFRHYSLREVGMVEIESEWTAQDRETARFRRTRKSVPRPRASLSLSKGQRQSTARTWGAGRALGAPGDCQLSLPVFCDNETPR